MQHCCLPAQDINYFDGHERFLLLVNLLVCCTADGCLLHEAQGKQEQATRETPASNVKSQKGDIHYQLSPLHAVLQTLNIAAKLLDFCCKVAVIRCKDKFLVEPTHQQRAVTSPFCG